MEKLTDIDFLKPSSIWVFCIFDSRYIAINQYDYWLDEDIKPGKDKIDDFIREKTDIVEKSRKEQEEKNNLLIEEFKQYVLNDPDFKLCTNQRLRRDYIYSVFNKEDTQKYRPAFIRNDGFPKYEITWSFIETVWRDYKYNHQ